MKHSLFALILLLGILTTIPAANLANATSKRSALTAFCTSLTTQNQPPLGHAFNLTFSCSNTPAFTAQQTTTGIPTYTLPTGYSALYITGPTTQLLTSGTPTTLPAGNYQYLAQYDGSSVSTLAGFTVTWSSR